MKLFNGLLVFIIVILTSFSQVFGQQAKRIYILEETGTIFWFVTETDVLNINICQEEGGCYSDLKKYNKKNIKEILNDTNIKTYRDLELYGITTYNYKIEDGFIIMYDSSALQKYKIGKYKISYNSRIYKCIGKAKLSEYQKDLFEQD